MTTQNQTRLQSFASLAWYEETIKFIFNFITKTSELLLAAGVVVSTTNFLTDGDVMRNNPHLSDAWAWAQAIAIDSSLGIVFINAFQAVREHDKVKAGIFFTLTAILATVAGLVTHFDALAHAANLPIMDKDVSGVIPLWIMTALRAIAVIGFLLTSRLKNFSFNELRDGWNQERRGDRRQEPATPQIDYHTLALTLAKAMQRAGTIEQIDLVKEEPAMLSDGRAGQCPGPRTPALPDERTMSTLPRPMPLFYRKELIRVIRNLSPHAIWLNEPTSVVRRARSGFNATVQHMRRTLNSLPLEKKRWKKWQSRRKVKHRKVWAGGER